MQTGNGIIDFVSTVHSSHAKHCFILFFEQKRRKRKPNKTQCELGTFLLMISKKNVGKYMHTKIYDGKKSKSIQALSHQCVIFVDKNSLQILF